MSVLLRSFWSEPRVADSPRRVWRDWALVAVLVALAVIEVAVREEIPYRWPSFVAALVGIPALLWRRTHPLAATLVVFGASIAIDIPWMIGGGEPPGLHTMVYALLISYALFRWGSGRDALLGLGVTLVAASLALLVENPTAGEAIGGPAVLTSSILLGLAVRYRARARTKEVDEIRAREREDLARDLHDTVAHHVSAIAIRAQAGLAAASPQPAAATEALRIIEAEASRTLAEMRTMVRMLRRHDPAELAPIPEISDISSLVRSPTPGPAVDVTFGGDVAGVPHAVSAAVYRLAQEAITNARRHARNATSIQVAVDVDEDAVRLQVHDDGAPATPAEHGYGLVGMAERAALMGGTCHAGPDPVAGWTVTAVLPRNGAHA